MDRTAGHEDAAALSHSPACVPSGRLPKQPIERLFLAQNVSWRRSCRRALFLSAAPAFAQPGGPASPCTRAQLLQSAEGYIQAQRTADPSTIPFGGEWITFNENFELSSMGGGMLGKALNIDYYRTLVVDEPSCATFTEVVVTDPKHPYVLGVLLQGRGAGKVSTVDMLVTDKGDWLFNAENTAKYAKAENWGDIPVADRDSADTIMAAANAYLDPSTTSRSSCPGASPARGSKAGSTTAKGARRGRARRIRAMSACRAASS